MTGTQTGTRSGGGGTTLYIPVAVILALVACVFGLSVFLRVSAVEISGAGNKYPPEDVLQAAGIMKGDNMLFVDTQGIADKIRSEMPYLEKVDVRPRFPDTIVIELTESIPVAFVYSGGDGWVIDSKCSVLGPVSGEYAQLIRVDGITPVDPKPGAHLSLGDIPNTRLEYLSVTLRAIEAAGITGDVESVDISNIAAISFKYLGRFTVVLGSSEQAVDKLSLLLDTVSGFEESASGKIILSEPGKARLVDSA